MLKSAVLNFLRRIILARLGQGCATFNFINCDLPLVADSGSAPLKIAIIGGGLAGMSAALVLGERGQSVTLLERNEYLGGKVGSWPIQFSDGSTTHISHGFHAFFRQYHNLRRLLARLGADSFLRPMSDYLVITECKSLRFGKISPVPLINIASMLREGFFSPMIFLKRSAWRLVIMLAYDRDRIFKDWDHVSFASFAKRAGLTQDFMAIMNNVCRSYFTAEGEMSTAEMFKASHTYFFSNDLGLVYDYMDDDYDATLIGPFRRALSCYGVGVRTGQCIKSIEVAEGGFLVDGERYDRLIVASDIRSARTLVASSRSINVMAPLLCQRLQGMKSARPYSVIRLWLDCDPFPQELPVFTFLERRHFLDSLTLVHRAEQESSEWSSSHRGAVIELHCYGLEADHVPSPEAFLDGFMDDLCHYFPAARDAQILHQELQVRNDFTSYAIGQDSFRPDTTCQIPGLTFAGDWIRLPIPAMLMEAACTSGLLAANEILHELGLRPEPIESVPLRGLLSPGNSLKPLKPLKRFWNHLRSTVRI